MKNNTPIVFQKDPSVDELTQAFVWWRYFSEESISFHLPIFPNAKLLVATIQGRIVWALMYQIVRDSFDKKILFPFFVEVLPEFRNNKIGSGLLDAIEELYKWEVSLISTSIPSSDISSQKMIVKVWFRSLGNEQYIKNARL